MINFEQIDDYLSNRLSEQETKAFEQQLAGDPSLQEEVEFQRRVVEGVRHARMAELKSMLNHVPVPGGSAWGGAKIAAAVVSAGVISTLVYLNMNDEAKPTEVKKETPVEVIVEPKKEEISKAEEVVTETPAVETKVEKAGVKENTKIADKGKEISAREEKKISSPVHKPDINVVDPSNELSADEDTDAAASGAARSAISTSKMEVITDIDNRKYNFHYQFAKGKLMLYGPFDKSLYEILEIHGDGHAVFLYYKENYYLLDEAQANITQLRPISDSALLKKLREYRGR